MIDKNNTRYYTLYHKKSEGVIKIKLLNHKKDRDWISRIEVRCDDENKVGYWNINYYIGIDRKRLKEVGNEIKESWIKEYEHQLEKFKNIKV